MSLNMFILIPNPLHIFYKKWFQLAMMNNYSTVQSLTNFIVQFLLAINIVESFIYSEFISSLALRNALLVPGQLMVGMIDGAP